MKDTSDVDPEREGLTPVEFVDGEKLPPVCLVCGSVVSGYVTVGEKNEVRTNDSTTVFAHVMGFIGGLIAIPIGREPTNKEYKISVQVPVCERHRSSAVLNPIFVDYDRYRITLPAHEKFQKAWKK